MKTPEQKPSNTVYISNLSYERDRNGIRSMFDRFGEIQNIKIVVEPSTNQSRGMAFVEMATIAQATKAIEALNGRIFDNRTVKAKYATPLKPSSIAKNKKIGDEKEERKKAEKDLSFKATQLAKKARNDKKRKSNPFDFKLTAKPAAAKPASKAAPKATKAPAKPAAKPAAKPKPKPKA
jgi:RNA recognition motif-containing protein